jgi:AcrR family transcriptional regulator
MGTTQSNKTVGEPRSSRTGRPRSLSHDAILDAAAGLIDEIPLESFTLAKLAARLGVSTMSLYTYYASRDLLLDAVAQRVFERFEAPETDGPFPERILAWLWALQRHLERNPVATKVMTWNGRVPVAWPRVWTPILRLIRDQGVEGAGLAITFDWFINAAIGLILTQHHAVEVSKSATVGNIGELEPENGILLLRFFYDLQSIGSEARFALGFRRLVEGLEACIAEERAKTPAR